MEQLSRLPTNLLTHLCVTSFSTISADARWGRNKNPDAHRERRGQGGCKKAAKDDSLFIPNAGRSKFVPSPQKKMAEHDGWATCTTTISGFTTHRSLVPLQIRNLVIGASTYSRKAVVPASRTDIGFEDTRALIGGGTSRRYALAEIATRSRCLPGRLFRAVLRYEEVWRMFPRPATKPQETHSSPNRQRLTC